MIIHNIFGKQINFMTQRITKKKQWTSEEVSLIKELYPQFPSKRWKRISQIFEKHGFERTQIQCRERWINFIDPKLNKDTWKEDELKKLYLMHQKVGSHWSVIQNYIGRTQNQIKNRFYGTLRNYIRFVLHQISGPNVCYNHEISKLSPKFLNLIYNSKEQFVFLEKQVKKSIFSMKFKIDKSLLAELINDKKNLYEIMCQKVLREFQRVKLKPRQSYSIQIQEEEVVIKQQQMQEIQYREINVSRQIQNQNEQSPSISPQTAQEFNPYCGLVYYVFPYHLNWNI